MIATHKHLPSFLGNIDYTDVLQQTKSISLNTEKRRCFEIETLDDKESEEPEKLRIRGTPGSHLIEFHPDSATIWIIDDESMYYQ